MGKQWKKAGKIAEAQKKGALFTKLAREITVASRLGGADPDMNARLKMAINAAKKVSCPNDTIDRAIKKGSGDLDGSNQIEELTYEGYGPHGVGVIVEAQTDNRNRTVSELRTIFKKNNGNLGDSGAVAWMFERVSLIEGKKDNVEDPEVDAIEAGANEVEVGEENVYSFYGAPEDLDNIRTALTDLGWDISAAELSYKANNITELSEEQKEEVIQLLDALDENEDSHRIYATID